MKRTDAVVVSCSQIPLNPLGERGLDEGTFGGELKKDVSKKKDIYMPEEIN